MITEDYVSFETAKLLKEKGFDVFGDGSYGTETEIHREYSPFGKIRDCSTSRPSQKGYPAPTLQMAMKWLREVHNIDIDIEAAVGMLGVKVYVPYISIYKPLEEASSKVRQIKRGIHYKDDQGVISALQYFDSYEEAIEAAIKYSLENLI